MKTNHSRILRYCLALFGTVTLALVLWGQESNPAQSHIGLVADWSSHHVIFSNPSDIQKAIQVRQDPRFWQQWLRRNVRASAPASAAEASGANADRSAWGGGGGVLGGGSGNGGIQRDWSVSMGTHSVGGQLNYPAKFSFGETAMSCANDFVVFNTGASGSGTNPTIIAYNDIYSSCGHGSFVPQTYWSFNTGSGSTILTSTSVTLSYDGTQVAFVQAAGNGHASLGLLKWKATGTLYSVSNALYSGCSAPCMTTIPFNGTPTDTNSSPFYDFASDTVYVGDDSGILHKFTPIFRGGTPAEVLTGGWPLNTTNGGMLTSPVYDQSSGNVFVADNEGFVYWANATGTPALTASAELGFGNFDFTDAPIVDSTAGEVYVFAADAGGAGHAGCGGGVAVCSAVFQLTTNFAAGATVGFGAIEAEIGLGSATPNVVYDGDFDNAYYTSANSTGHLYACGNAHGVSTLYEITITAGAMKSGAGTTGPPLTAPGTSTRCSPLTEFYNANAGADYLFLSVEGDANTTTDSSCTANLGCIMAFTLGGTAISPATTTAVGAMEPGGTSGISIDNDASAASGGSEVYFVPLETETCATSDSSGACAIQASQSLLQ
ncbi:MAG: hypothetical protein WA755_14945 [Candidatus Acidiferrales bacterium]